MTTLAVGFFDGVHRGHQAILSQADAALTFFEHPLSVLSPEKAPRLITDFETRIRLMGLPVTVLRFTRELANMSAADFAARYLKGCKVRCGANWRFGRAGEGNVDWLRENCYEVEVVEYAEYRGEIVSSSRIRQAIAAGDVESVEAMLGRAYALSGEVASGKGQGTQLGYPTLNAHISEAITPLKCGVYSAIVNYGVAPTFAAHAWQRPVLEAHLLKFIREERKFASPDELKAQINRDIREVMP